MTRAQETRQTRMYWILVCILGIYAIFGLIPAAADQPPGWFGTLLIALAIAMPSLSVTAGITLRKDTQQYMPFLFTVTLPVYSLALVGLFLDMRPSLAFFTLLGIVMTATIYNTARLYGLVKPKSWLETAGSAVQAWCSLWVILQLGIWGLPGILIVFCLPLIVIIAAPQVVSLIGLMLCAVLPFLILNKRHAVIFLLAMAVITGCSACLTRGGWMIPVCLFCILVWGIVAGYSSVQAIRTYLYTPLKSFALSAKAHTPSRAAAGLLCIALLAVVTLLFAVGTSDNNGNILHILVSQNISERQKRGIIHNAEQYKQILTEIYLTPYFYPLNADLTLFWSENKEPGTLRKMALRSAKPFFYPGSSQQMRKEQDRAATLYKMAFGLPIDKGERTRIENIVKGNLHTTYAPPRSDKVFLAAQDIRLEEHGEWADIELHQEFHNVASYRGEKATLLLRLPPGSVITDLWLGENGTRTFRAVVSPRGAAQKTFNAIVRRGQDPALLEQVGTNLYRLQVYPVPVRRNKEKPDPSMHVWVELRSIKQDDSQWLLPTIEAGNNIFWTADTQLSVNGRAWVPDVPAMAETIGTAQLFHMPDTTDGYGLSPMPVSLPVTSHSLPTSHVVSLGETIAVLEPRAGKKDGTLPGLAVFLDTSADMSVEKGALLKAARRINMEWEGTVTFYIQEEMWQPITDTLQSRLDDHIFWGLLDADGLETVREAAGNAIPVILTNKARLQHLSEHSNTDGSIPGLHLLTVDGAWADMPDVALMRAVHQAGGGIDYDAVRLMEAIEREHQIQYAPAPETSVAFPANKRYAWRFFRVLPPTRPQVPLLGTGASQDPKSVMTASDQLETAHGRSMDAETADFQSPPQAAHPYDVTKARTPLPPLGQLAAQALIEHSRKELPLDHLHEIAKKWHIVSRYSSLLALVEEWQRDLLAREEQQAGRFAMEKEAGAAASPVPVKQGGSPYAPDILPSAVPEPEEWALIIAGAFILLRRFWQGRMKRVYGLSYA